MTAFNSTMERSLSSYNLGSLFPSLTSYSRKVYPRTMEQVFAYCEELWLHHGIYTQAVSKAVRYFLTELEIAADEDSDYETRKRYLEEIEKKFDIMSTLAIVGDDLVAFGNSFSSLYYPFDRYLICTKCGSRYPIRELYPDSVKWDSGKFSGRCPSCQTPGVFKVEDMHKASSVMLPRVIHWPPQYMMIQQNPVSGKKIFYLQVLRYQTLTAAVRGGDPEFLSDTPWEIIEAILDNKMLRFQDDQILHLALTPPTIFSDQLSGWGLPKFMAEFSTVFLLFLLDRYNECIVSEYLVPFRILSPPPVRDPGMMSMDPMLGANMGTFVSNMRRMLEMHRRNPTGYNFSPFPVQYQVLGGDAQKLVPVELIQHEEQRLLTSMGIPYEMYQPTEANSVNPLIGFHMFEKTWKFLPDQLNSWLYWFVNSIGSLNRWRKVRPYLIPPTQFENPEQVRMKLELAGAKVISQTTALRAANINYVYERRRIMEEEMELAKERADAAASMDQEGAAQQAMMVPGPGQQVLMEQEQEQQQAAASGQPMPPMGQAVPPAQGAVGPTSLDQLEAEANEISDKIITMDASQRRSALIDLKKNNEVLHSRVTSLIEEKENRAGMQGKNMARQGQIPVEPAG